MEGFATGKVGKHTGISSVRGGAETSEARFEKLYLENFGYVYGYVRSRMSSEAEAEDIVSEAFLKAARAFASFDPSRASFGVWVIAIAKNCMASYFRKIRSVTAIEDAPERALSVPGEQDNVDDRELVEQLLACLDDDERLIVACKYRDGLRNVDIAEELGMNPSTVSTKLAKALAKMRVDAKRSM